MVEAEDEQLYRELGALLDGRPTSDVIPALIIASAPALSRSRPTAMPDKLLARHPPSSHLIVAEQAHDMLNMEDDGRHINPALIGSTVILTDPNFIHLATEPGQAHFASTPTILAGSVCIGQSTGREDEARDPEASAVPESVRAVHDEGHAADPTFGDELPLSPAQSKSAGTIDLAIAARRARAGDSLSDRRRQRMDRRLREHREMESDHRPARGLAETTRAIERASVTQGC